MSDLIDRQDAMDAVKRLSLGETDAVRLAMRIMDYLERLSSAQPEEDCDTCKHGYFGDEQCNNCRVRYPSHYERRTDD